MREGAGVPVSSPRYRQCQPKVTWSFQDMPVGGGSDHSMSLLTLQRLPEAVDHLHM